MYAPEATILSTILITFVVFGGIIGFFIFSMIKQHRKNIEMYKSKLSAEITTLEKERARISADLHDDLGPMLSVIKMKVSSIDVNPEDEPLLEEAEGYIDGVIKKIRLISNDLLPGTLLRKGLVFAIQEFIQIIGSAKNMKISFTHDTIPSLPRELCVNLYRIVQEITHNAVKHSGADHLKISLNVINDKLILVCSDNGKGFDYNKAGKERSGLGLRNLWSRTELLHGDLYLESNPGEGTTYTIEFPLKPKP